MSRTPFQLADEDDDSNDDVTQPILQNPSFRFGQPLNTSPSQEQQQQQQASRPKFRLSSSPSGNNQKHTLATILPLRLSPTSATASVESSPSPSSSSQRKSFTTPALVIIVIAVILLLITDASTGIISKTLGSTFGTPPIITSPPSSPSQPQPNNNNNNNNNNTNNNSTDNNNSFLKNDFDGIPPNSLPLDNPNKPLLDALRGYTNISPRWPSDLKDNILKLKTYGPAYASIIVSHKLKIVYIPVFKVATTSTMYMIAYLENNQIILDAIKKKDGSHMQLLHDMSSPAWKNHTVFNLSPSEISDILNDPTYLKFGFVRNPYDRLVSAYVDKISRPTFTSYEYQQQLHSLYGDDEDSSKRRKYEQEKPSFIQFVNDASKILKLPRVTSSNFSKSEAYENNLSRRDLHWRPQNELLHSDLIHVDFVGLYDQMNQDRDKLLQWIYTSTDRRMPEAEKRRLHTSDPTIKIQLLQKLRDDDQLREQVQNMYKDDFERFHFNTDVPVSTEEIM